MTTISPTTESNDMTICDGTEAVLEQVPSQNQARPKQGWRCADHFIHAFLPWLILIFLWYAGVVDTNNWGKCEVGSNILKLNAGIELDQADWYGNLPIHHECSRLEYLSEKGRERDSFVSSTQMEATQPTVSTKERHLESLNKIKEFVRRNPDCVKQSNQFGYLPLHSSLDKTTPNALVVEYLVKSFPDALYIACNEGWRHIYPFDIFCEVSLTMLFPLCLLTSHDVTSTCHCVCRHEAIWFPPEMESFGWNILDCFEREPFLGLAIVSTTLLCIMKSTLC